MATQSKYDTSVRIASDTSTFTRQQLHDLRRVHAERSTGELGTNADLAISEFIDWAFSADREDYDE